jgi:hypothetical protein
MEIRISKNYEQERLMKEIKWLIYWHSISLDSKLQLSTKDSPQSLGLELSCNLNKANGETRRQVEANSLTFSFEMRQKYKHTYRNNSFFPI